MKQQEIQTYLRIAQEISKLSYCKRLQVGAVIVVDRQIVSNGYNGTIPKWPNQCEDSNGKTKLDVLHAEENAILKAAKRGVAIDGGSLFLTHSPCISCTKMILSVGIKHVYFINKHASFDETKKFFIFAGIPLTQVKLDD